jgi:hypothetical protein
MSRLLGLLIILRALAPILLVALIVLTVNNVVADLRLAVEEPLDRINDQAEVLRGTFDEAKTAYQQVETRVTTVVNSIRQLPNLIPDISAIITIPAITLPDPVIPLPTFQVTNFTLRYPSGINFSSVTILGFSVPSGLNITWSNVSIPTITTGVNNFRIDLPNIPAFNVPIPGLDIIEAALGEVTGVFDDVSNAFKEVTDLGTILNVVPDEFNQLIADGNQLVRSVREVGVRWESNVRTVILAAVILFVVIYVTSFLEALDRGWRMLLGLPQTQP